MIGRTLSHYKLLEEISRGGKVLSEERDVVPASQWFTMAEGELVEEVLGLGRYGKTLTVLTCEGPCDYLDRTFRGE